VSRDSIIVAGYLREAGTTCDRLRERTERMSLQVESPTQEAAETVRGFKFQQALQDLRMTRRDDFRRLVQRLNATRDALINSSVRYERNEEATADLFRTAEGPW
jgi:hypothetical protein